MSGYEFQHWADVITKFGFSIIALIGLGFFVWHIWKWVTNTVNPALSDCGSSLSKLKKSVKCLIRIHNIFVFPSLGDLSLSFLIFHYMTPAKPSLMDGD